MTRAQMDFICQRWDQTAPEIQRRAIARILNMLVTTEGVMLNLLSACKAAEFYLERPPDAQKEMAPSLLGLLQTAIAIGEGRRP